MAEVQTWEMETWWKGRGVAKQIPLLPPHATLTSWPFRRVPSRTDDKVKQPGGASLTGKKDMRVGLRVPSCFFLPCAPHAFFFRARSEAWPSRMPGAPSPRPLGEGVGAEGVEGHGGKGVCAHPLPPPGLVALVAPKPGKWRGDPLAVTDSSLGGWSMVRCRPRAGRGPSSRGSSSGLAAPPAPPRAGGDRQQDSRGRRADRPGQVQRPRVWGLLRPRSAQVSGLPVSRPGALSAGHCGPRNPGNRGRDSPPVPPLAPARAPSPPPRPRAPCSGAARRLPGARRPLRGRVRRSSRPDGGAPGGGEMQPGSPHALRAPPAIRSRSRGGAAAAGAPGFR